MIYENRFTTKCTHEMMKAMSKVAESMDMSNAEYVRYCIKQDLRWRNAMKTMKVPF